MYSLLEMQFLDSFIVFLAVGKPNAQVGQFQLSLIVNIGSLLSLSDKHYTLKQSISESALYV